MDHEIGRRPSSSDLVCQETSTQQTEPELATEISQKRMLRTTNKLYLLRARMFVTLSFTVALIFQP